VAPQPTTITTESNESTQDRSLPRATTTQRGKKAPFRPSRQHSTRYDQQLGLQMWTCQWSYHKTLCSMFHRIATLALLRAGTGGGGYVSKQAPLVAQRQEQRQGHSASWQGQSTPQPIQGAETWQRQGRGSGHQTGRQREESSQRNYCPSSKVQGALGVAGCHCQCGRNAAGGGIRALKDLQSVAKPAQDKIRDTKRCISI
jgi:hypothetical protein